MARAYRPSRLNPSTKKVSSSSKVPLSKHQLARKAKNLKRIAAEKANAPGGLILARLKKKYGVDQNKHKQSKSNKEEVEVVKKTEKSERFVEIDETEAAKEVKDNGEFQRIFEMVGNIDFGMSFGNGSEVRTQTDLREAR